MLKSIILFFILPFRPKRSWENEQSRDLSVIEVIGVYVLSSVLLYFIFGLAFSVRYKPALSTGYPLIGYLFLPIVMIVGDFVLYLILLFFTRSNNKKSFWKDAADLVVFSKLPTAVFSFLLNRIVTSPFFFLLVLWQIILLGIGYRSRYQLSRRESVSTMIGFYVIYAIVIAIVDRWLLYFIVNWTG